MARENRAEVCGESGPKQKGSVNWSADPLCFLRKENIIEATFGVPKFKNGLETCKGDKRDDEETLDRWQQCCHRIQTRFKSSRLPAQSEPKIHSKGMWSALSSIRLPPFARLFETKRSAVLLATNEEQLFALKNQQFPFIVQTIVLGKNLGGPFFSENIEMISEGCVCPTIEARWKMQTRISRGDEPVSISKFGS